MPRHKLNSTYSNMKKRCYNEKYPYYHRYGGRGIKIDGKWLGKKGFQNFLKDMGERPIGYELDRINNDGNYSKENCRWTDKYTQMGNTSNTKIIPGVSWLKQRNKFRARIKVKGKDIHLGLFNSIPEALIARQEAKKLYVPNH